MWVLSFAERTAILLPEDWVDGLGKPRACDSSTGAFTGPAITWKLKNQEKTPKIAWSVDHVGWISVLLYYLEVDNGRGGQTCIYSSKCFSPALHFYGQSKRQIQFGPWKFVKQKTTGFLHPSFIQLAAPNSSARGELFIWPITQASFFLHSTPSHSQPVLPLPTFAGTYWMLDSTLIPPCH